MTRYPAMQRLNSSKFMGGLLLLGGVATGLWGLGTAIAPGSILAASGISSILTAAADDALTFAWRLHGLYAAVAGFAYIAVALRGGFALRAAMTGALLVQSLLALWLLPARGLDWCAVHEGACSALTPALIYAAMGLHVLIVLGCVVVFGLIATGGAQEKRGLRFSRKAR